MKQDLLFLWRQLNGMELLRISSHRLKLRDPALGQRSGMSPDVLATDLFDGAGVMAKLT